MAATNCVGHVRCNNNNNNNSSKVTSVVQQTLRSQLTHPASAQFGSVPHNSVELRSVRCSQHSATCNIQMATSIKSFVCAHLHILCFRYIFLLQYNFLYSTSAPNLMHDSHALCHSFSFVHKYYSHTYIHIYSHINPMYTLEIMCMQLSICIYTYVCVCMCVCVSLSTTTCNCPISILSSAVLCYDMPPLSHRLQNCQSCFG